MAIQLSVRLNPPTREALDHIYRKDRDFVLSVAVHIQLYKIGQKLGWDRLRKPMPPEPRQNQWIPKKRDPGKKFHSTTLRLPDEDEELLAFIRKQSYPRNFSLNAVVTHLVVDRARDLDWVPPPRPRRLTRVSTRNPSSN